MLRRCVKCQGGASARQGRGRATRTDTGTSGRRALCLLGLLGRYRRPASTEYGTDGRCTNNANGERLGLLMPAW